MAAQLSGPWFVMGDFNLTRDPADRNNANFNSNLAEQFNNAIYNLQLMELPLMDRQFTWSNKRAIPTLARLDRAFFNLAINDLFLGAQLTSGLHPTSDHTPILASIQTNIPKPSAFHLERSWLLDPSSSRGVARMVLCAEQW